MRKYYRYYFEQLVSKNKQLKAFYFVKDKYDLQAFDNAIKSAGVYPALLLETYDYDTSGSSKRNYFKHLTGRFTILTGAITGDQQSIDDAQSLCEEIADDVIAKMREDLEEGDVITINDDEISKKVFFLVDNVKTDFVGPMSTKYYGTTTSFVFDTPFVAIKNPDNWI